MKTGDFVDIEGLKERVQFCRDMRNYAVAERVQSEESQKRLDESVERWGRDLADAERELREARRRSRCGKARD